MEALHTREDQPIVRLGAINFISKQYLRRKMVKIFSRFEELSTKLRQNIINKSRSLFVRIRDMDFFYDNDINNFLDQEFSKRDDFNQNFIMTREATEWKSMLLKVIGKIQTDTFNPKAFSTPRGAKFCSIVPSYKVGARHVPIDAQIFHHLLSKSGFDVPLNANNFRDDYKLQLKWANKLFNFRRQAISCSDIFSKQWILQL